MLVRICRQEGSCCFEKGSEAIETVRKNFPEIEVVESGCLGVCKSVVAEIDGKLYSELSTEQLIQLIESKM